MWLSMFVLRSSPRPDRPPGLYGAAFVDYREGSPLTYQELLVARLVREGRSPRVRITDIWVDSEESRAGGRSLWAIPKELGELSLDEHRTGPWARTTVAGFTGGQRLGTGRFTAAATAPVRTPFAASTSQVREDGSVVVTAMRGSARTLPCRGSWDFDPQGPLGFLHGRRPVASFRLTDLHLTFG